MNSARKVGLILILIFLILILILFHDQTGGELLAYAKSHPTIPTDPTF